jgi:3-methyl-2-oxobutanoate hydroxymethyltransferase
VIGIGAGDGCDGQVRVTADLLGLTPRQPPFSPPLIQGRNLAVSALQDWVNSQQVPQAAALATIPELPAAPRC